jgi:ATP-dependent Clp protease ATP-binding subunit ClpC
VGKTEVAKVLAREMGVQLVRFDMSEYTEKHTVAKLIGSPAGYVGYEDGGLLTDAIRKTPNCVLLLDEIEKAHADIYNILLQVMDYARLTDNKGHKADFRNVVLIMTSNAGTRQLKDFGRGVGFNAGSSSALMLNEQDKEHARQIVQKALSKQFSPEFLNRLDEIITFDQLDLEAIKRIIDVELKGLYRRIADLGYTIDLSDEAKAFVAEKGYDVQFGARPLKRAIQTYIEDGISELIVNEDLQPDSIIHISKVKEKEELSFTTE